VSTRSPKTAKRSFFPKINKIGASRIATTSGHRQTTETFSHQQWRNSNPGNNSNRNKMTCIFCQKQGHQQEECRKRINSNQPCLDSNSKPFWPKINMTENGALIEALQDQDFQY
jgi:hypothetical protein